MPVTTRLSLHLSDKNSGRDCFVYSHLRGNYNDCYIDQKKRVKDNLIDVQYDSMTLTKEDIHFILRSIFMSFSIFIFYEQYFAISFL